MRCPLAMAQDEIELKLLLPGAVATAIEQQLRSLKVLARRSSQVHELWNVYYDTPDQQLRQQRHALRMRRVHAVQEKVPRAGKATKGTWIQTFKSAGTSTGGLSQRGEWETQERSAQLNRAALRDTPWAELDPDDQRFDTLQPCFQTRCRRTTWQLHRYQGASIEVALDVGEITAEGRSAPILELELELQAGPPEALFQLAKTLAQHIAVLPCDASKAERGYRLASATPDPVSPAKPARLARDIQPSEAATAVLRHLYEQLTRHLAALSVVDDPEVVHQARVTWRRWKSALRVFSPWLAHRPDTRGLKPLLTELGYLRDLDVLRCDTLPRWTPAFVANEPARQQTVDETILRIDSARSAQRARARAVLATPATGSALLSLAHELSTPGTADTPHGAKAHAGKRGRSHPASTAWAVKRFARLERRLSRARTAARQTGAAPQAQHLIRLRAKQARYGAEMLRDLLPKKRQKALVRQTTRLQTDMGNTRDLLQAVKLLSSMPVDPALAEFLRGVAAGQGPTPA